MNFGEELKSAAIVGTAQKDLNLPATDGKLGAALAKLDRADREKFLLSAAAVFAAWQTAGKSLPTDKENLPEISEPDTKEILSGRLRQIFETLFDASEKSHLPEFLDLMRRRGKIIPPELLPETFAAADNHFNFGRRDLRHQILPVAGNRGKWLARRGSEWRWALVEEIGGEIWETGKSGERIFALEFFRKKDPGMARELLQAVWKTESSKARQKFLEVLRVNLSRKDESFLDEVFRTDKSAEVKATAFQLLANLPETKLCAEFAEFFLTVLSVKKKFLGKGEIEVYLPADWDEKTANLKSIAKQIFSDTRYFGEKAAALALGLSVINPEEWEKSLNLKPDQIVTLAHKGDWARALLAGFGMASLRFENNLWFGEILKSNAGFALTMSPLFVWGLVSFSIIPAQRILSLLLPQPAYNFTDWLLANLEFEPEADKAEFPGKAKDFLTEFTKGEGFTGWKNLAAALPLALIDEWLEGLEKMKSRENFGSHRKKIYEETISLLSLRKEYILEFEK